MLNPLRPRCPSERPNTSLVNIHSARFVWVALFLSTLSFSAWAQSDLKEEVGRTDIGTAIKELNSAAQAQPVVDNPGQSQQLIRIIPFGRKSGNGIKQQAPVGAHLTYFGGPVISTVEVVVVFWGPNVSTAITATGTIDQFYTDITTSRYFDLLTEYSTAGITSAGGVTSNQTIGHGSFNSTVTITPSVCPGSAACTVTDTQIQAELTNQINSHVLPAPRIDARGILKTYYAIYFPPNVTISINPTTSSCVSGGFCAYHSDTGTNIPYGVMPDFSAGGCSAQGACGSGTTLQIATGVSSHELAEAVTDADVGTASVFGPPLAWYDNPPNLGEIADLCDQNPLSSVSVGGRNYTVESLFSNLQNDCVFAPPVFNITAPAQAGPGVAFNAPLAINGSNSQTAITGYTGTVHFTSSDAAAILPGDYTFVAADAGTHSFSFTLGTLGQQTITVTDTRSSGFTGSATLNVNTTPDLTIAKSHTGTFFTGQTGATYTILVSNIGGGTTSGTVTVTDTLPTGLLATAIGGTGWTCTLATLTCTRTDGLTSNNSYPAITLTVNVTAASATTIINTAAVSGGNDGNPLNNSVIDPTSITTPIVDLRAAVVGNNSVIQGTNGYTFTTSVTNVGTLASNAPVFVNNTLGLGLTATAISGTGWNCTLATISCTRTDSLAPGAAYPDITVTLNIALNAPGSTTIVSIVGGGGSATSDGSVNLFITPVVSIVSNTTSTTITAGQPAQYLIGMSIGTAAGTTTFSCTGLPNASTCSFNPPSLTTSGNVTMTIGTTARGSSIQLPAPSERLPFIFLALLSLAALACFSLRTQPRVLRKLAPVLGAAVLIIGVLAGCGGGNSPPPPPPPVVGTAAGTYTITFTATSPNGTASRNMSLIVR